MTVLYDDIGELVTNDPTAGDGTALGVLTDAALLTDGDRIVWLGPKARAPQADQRIDCAGTSVVPGFVDSHAHLVFAGDRAAEFAARMSGRPYDGGGIANSQFFPGLLGRVTLVRTASGWRHHLRDQEWLRAEHDRRAAEPRARH